MIVDLKKMKLTEIQIFYHRTSLGDSKKTSAKIEGIKKSLLFSHINLWWNLGKFKDILKNI